MRLIAKPIRKDQEQANCSRPFVSIEESGLVSSRVPNLDGLARALASRHFSRAEIIAEETTSVILSIALHSMILFSKIMRLEQLKWFKGKTSDVMLVKTWLAYVLKCPSRSVSCCSYATLSLYILNTHSFCCPKGTT